MTFKNKILKILTSLLRRSVWFFFNFNVMAFPLLGILEFYVPIRQKYSVLYLSQKKFKITAGLKMLFK
jgi:hypothetical protein